MRFSAVLGSLLAVLPLAALPLVARADTTADPKKPAEGGDEPVYSCKPRTGEVSVQFKPEMDVKDLVSWAMGTTCKNFALDPRIVAATRKVTLVAPNRMPPDEAYRVFLTALRTIGYAVVDNGSVVKVVESSFAKRESLGLTVGGGVPGTDKIVRYVYRPTYAQADSLMQAFTALKSDPGEVVLVGSMLMLTDYGSHVRDMLALAKLIDVPKGSDGLYLVPVHNGDAKAMVDKLTQLLGAPTASAPMPPAGTGKSPTAPIATLAPSKIVVDERTNTLIVAGSNAAYERVRALVDKLDIQLDMEGNSTIHVYKLGSSVAEDLAKVLESLISGRGSQTTKAAVPGQSTPLPTGGPETAGSSIDGQVRIQAEKLTNSLIIMSSGRDYLALKEVIRQLDLPKRQVYIETVIMEVDQGSSLDFGTSSHGGIPGTNMLLGGVQLPPLSSLGLGSGSSDSVANLPSGLVGAVIGKELPGSRSLFGKSIPSYGLLFQALAGNDHTRVITSPSLFGVDNEDAKHKSGINIAYQRGSSTFVNGGVTTQQNIERKPLNLELTVRPHIFVDDNVLLELKLDSEDLGGEDKLGQPIWTNRSIDTKVVVHDQQTVVIGTLSQDRSTLTATKVPILGDIPILGHLFKYTKSSKRKTNLVVMMTPYIIKDRMDIHQIAERKLREMHEFSSSFDLDHTPYVPKIDYTRKRGLVEEINRTMISIDEDVAARNALKQPPRIEAGPIEYAPGAP